MTLLEQGLKTAASIVFPWECETCNAVLWNSSPVFGVCARCESEVKFVRAPHCVSCGKTLNTPVEKCAECLPQRFHYDRAYACALYEGKMKELIHHYKFGRRRHLKNFFSFLMEKFIDEHLVSSTFDVIAAVPLDAHKSRERGFNQSELLSRKLSKHLGIPEISPGLRRFKSSQPQSLLRKSERTLNVKGQFSVTRKEFFHSKRVLLIDDILTTGQTASECARVIKESGAKAVTVLALARGL